MQIEYWSDVVCPWCFVGRRRLQRALADFPHAEEVEVVHRSFELDPSAPHHGHEPTLVSLSRKYGRSEDEMRQGMQQLVEIGREEGLELRVLETVHTNTVDAHRLLHLALEVGGPALQGEVAEALFAAYFLRAEDVGDHEVLLAATVSAGLDEQRVRDVLSATTYADAVRADVEQARALGATGVPFVVVDRRWGVSGAQSSEVFGQVLEQAWADTLPTGG